MTIRNGPKIDALPLLLCVSACWISSPSTAATSGSCGEMARTQQSPHTSRALSGSEFVREISGLSETQREAAILQQALEGNFPTFLRHSEPVTLSGRSPEGDEVSITLCVSPDYLAIGSDTDYLYVPMRLRTAITVANHYDSLLPTRRMVDAIYAQAAVHLAPQPLPAGDTMRSTGYYWHHSELVREQRLSFETPLGALTAGDKKDLVLTNRFWASPASVAIYGWHLPGGRPIQPLSTWHGSRYADYSHGVRLVSAVAYINGAPRPVRQLLQDHDLANILSDEGVINADELLRLLESDALTSASCPLGANSCNPTQHVEKIAVVGKPQESGRHLRAALPIDLTHPLDQMLHE